MSTLEQLLLESDPARLEIVARRWGMERPPKRRRKAVAALTARMLAPQELEQAWATLTPPEKEAIAALQAAGGRMAWPTFTRRWGCIRAMGPGRLARERPWETPVSPAEGLWYRGLLFRAVVEGPAGLYEAALLPDDLQARLPPAHAAPQPRPEPTKAPPIILSAGRHLLDDGCTLLAYLQNHRVRPGPKGKWPATDESRLARRLRDPNPERLAFLRHLADRLGWLRVDRAGRLRPDPDLAAAWLQAPPDEQQAVLARAWLDDPTWNDLYHVPTLRPDDTGSWHNDPLIARQAVLRHLAACRPREWYDLTGFVTVIKEADPDFQRPDGDYSTWYIRDAATGAHLSGFESWNRVEGALIRYMLVGPLAWLGLVDLGAERADGAATTFRLSPTGAAFWGHGAEETHHPVEPLTIRPDLSLLVPAARRYERFQLSRVADWRHTGDPYIYRLTPASLERAQRQNIGIERIADFLTEATGGRTPHVLQPALEHWSRHGSQVRLERRVLLRVRDEKLLQKIAAAPASRHLIREVIGPTAALVAPADRPRLVQALVEQGLLPDLPEPE